MASAVSQGKKTREDTCTALEVLKEIFEVWHRGEETKSNSKSIAASVAHKTRQSIDCLE